MKNLLKTLFVAIVAMSVTVAFAQNDKNSKTTTKTEVKKEKKAKDGKTTKMTKKTSKKKTTTAPAAK